MISNSGFGTGKKLIHEELTRQIIGAAMEVHKELGPGLMESVYEECLCYELNLRKLAFKRQLPVPVIYKGVKLDCGFLPGSVGGQLGYIGTEVC
jgi:hypothetical protein